MSVEYRQKIYNGLSSDSFKIQIAENYKKYTLEQLEKHFESDCPLTNQIVGCNYCGEMASKVFNDVAAYKEHLENKCTGTKFNCQICKKIVLAREHDKDGVKLGGHTYRDCIYHLLS